jgi:hypothetical protein
MRMQFLRRPLSPLPRWVHWQLGVPTSQMPTPTVTMRPASTGSLCSVAKTTG